MCVAYTPKNFGLITSSKQGCLLSDPYSYALGSLSGLIFFMVLRKSGHLKRSLGYKNKSNEMMRLRGGGGQGPLRIRLRTLKTRLPGEKKKSLPESRRAKGSAGA